MGGLIVFTQGSVVAPFIYSILMSKIPNPIINLFTMATAISIPLVITDQYLRFVESPKVMQE